MSEEAGGGEQGPVFALERVYIKDLSFEAPNSPAMFTRSGNPHIDMDLSTRGQVLDEAGHLESVLTVTVKATLEQETVFIAEVQQAGLFRVAHIPQDQIEPLLGINCPSILFPYAREAISSLVARGGFQQLLLDPVNFQALYEQAQQNQGTDEGSTKEH
jgi:preprotein translocase subunit SecB